MDMKMTTLAVQVLMQAENYREPEWHLARQVILSQLNGAHKDVLLQIWKRPTWDGDVCSKSARDDLLECGLAVRCCFNEEQGHTAATYAAHSIAKELFTIKEAGVRGQNPLPQNKNRW